VSTDQLRNLAWYALYTMGGALIMLAVVIVIALVRNRLGVYEP
jgi:hypothetical protein